MSSDSSNRSARILGLIVTTCILVVLLVFLWPKSASQEEHGDEGHAGHEGHGRGGKERVTVNFKRAPFSKPLRDGDPKGVFFHVFDKSKVGNRFLLSRNGYKDLLPDSDAPSGMDLILQDEDGTERVLAESVVRAKFSPDGSKVAYTTSDATLHVETLTGEKITKIDRAYDPDFRPDSAAVVYSQGPEGTPANMPETLKISTVDLATGETKDWTQGGSDDVRPHYGPDGKCILFVNGGRTGLASFWRVCEGGEPEQVTNLRMQGVNDLFVPTPYMRSGWSPDNRWFVYDFKQGEREETWGMEFDTQGNLLQTKKIGTGIDPRWKDDGRTLTALQHDGERVTAVEYTLP